MSMIWFLIGYPKVHTETTLEYLPDHRHAKYELIYQMLQ